MTVFDLFHIDLHLSKRLANCKSFKQSCSEKWKIAYGGNSDLKLGSHNFKNAAVLVIFKIADLKLRLAG